MYLQHYDAIKAQGTLGMPAIKTRALFNDQYNRTELLEAIAYPAEYVEFPTNMLWNQEGNNVQTSEVEIFFHIVVFNLDTEPNALLNLAVEHYKFFNRRFLLDTGSGDAISTELVRNSTNELTTFDQIKVMKIGYITSLIDCSGIQTLTPVSPTLIVEPS